MSMLDGFLHRLSVLWRGERYARDLEDEIRHHRELDALSAGPARAEDPRRFGNVTYYREETRAMTPLRWLDRARRDTTYAVRALARSPGFTLAVVLTLALGFGADTGIFTVVEGVLLRPVAAPALDRLVVIKEDIRSLNLLDAQLSPAEIVDLTARKDLFDDGAGYGGTQATLAGFGDPQQLIGAQTMGNLFGIFGVRPYLGRLYVADDSRPGSRNVVVLTYATWHDVMHADSAVIGRSIDFGGAGTTADRPTVIGVLPPEFHFPASAQFYRPLTLTPQWFLPQNRGSLFITPVFRARAGVTLDRIQAGLHDEVAHWVQRYSDSEFEAKLLLRAEPFVNFVAGSLRPILLVLLGAVALVLLIACANVACLQLLRAAARGRETAVRAALGADGAAIVRQSLVESLVLAVAGAIGGITVGELLVRLVARLDIKQYQMLRAVHLDARVLAATAAVAIACAVAFGLAPAVRAAKADPQDALREAGGLRGASLGHRQHHFLRGMVVLQVALTMVLLFGSVLTIRSLGKLLSTDLGFRPDQVTTMRIAPPAAHYPSSVSRIAFYNELQRRLAAIPGVSAAGFTWGLPFADGGTSSPFTLAGQPVQPGEPPRHANMRAVAGDYFRAMGVPIIAGRAFGSADQDTNQVNVIVDEELAKSFFPGQSAIGRRINQGRDATIIGVVGNVVGHAIGEPLHPTVYYNYPQFMIPTLHAVIRSSLPPALVMTQAREAIRQMDGGIAIYDIRTMSDRVMQSLGPRRLAMMVLTGFAALSLLLAALGIYGVLSYITAQRRREIGIRIALGADAAGVTRMIVHGGIVLAGLGIGAGLLAFAALGRVVQSVNGIGELLYGVHLWDATTVATALAVVVGCTLAACLLPARRAARVDPIIAMRNE